MNGQRFARLGASVSVSAFLACSATPIFAQDTNAAAAGGAAQVAEAPATDAGIVVTGSRIARDGVSAPTPVTVIGNGYLTARATTNIADALNEIPAFRGSSTPNTTGTSATTAGVNFVDLRGLGSNRTLLLVDGKRHVPTSVTGRVDLNMIPSILIDRVEVVTGGASAVYGSDAVAGVVNLVYKDHFEGLEGTAQADAAAAGDAKGYNFELHAGRAFLDDRFHLSVAGQAFHNSGVGGQYNRGWGRKEYYLITNPTPANGLPTRIISDDVHNATMTKYGLITSGPLRGTQFDANGVPMPFTYGSLVGSQYMIGGDGEGQNFLYDFWLQPRISRQLASIQAAYSLTTDIELKSEFYYARSHVFSQSVGPFDFGTLTIRRDNAFLPAAIAARMDAANVSSFGFGRFSLDVGPNTIDNVTQSYRWVESAHGTLGDWKWDGYYQFGRVNYLAGFDGVRNNARYLAAIDSVIDPATGQAVCRSTLTSPGNGCVAYNPFGDQASQASRDYVTGDQFFRLITKQHVAAANLTGELADLWAGPLSVSVGGEYRHEQAAGAGDALGQANAYAAGNYKPIRGSYDVAEGSVEAELPVLRDLPFARAVDLNGAARYAHYSTSGGAVTWKVGGTWEPIDGLRLRATRSRDVRAPNLSELYASAVTRITSVTDPFNGNALIFVPTVTSGSATLKPEVARTLTLGASYVAPWARGLRASVDYYEIKIRDAISSLAAQDIVDRCYAGDQSLCPLLVRSGGSLAEIDINQVNIASLRTKGIDFELSYTMPLAGGTLSWRGLATYVAKYDLSDGRVVTRLAGQYNGSGVPHWVGNTTLSYTRARISGAVTGRFLGGAKYDNAFVEGVSINDNSVTSRFYLDLNAQWDMWRAASGPGKVTAFLVVNNLLDKAPSIAPQTTSPTNPAYFDVVGRAFRAGIRFRL